MRQVVIGRLHARGPRDAQIPNGLNRCGEGTALSVPCPSRPSDDAARYRGTAVVTCRATGQRFLRREPLLTAGSSSDSGRRVADWPANP